MEFRTILVHTEKERDVNGTRTGTQVNQQSQHTEARNGTSGCGRQRSHVASGL